MARAIRSRGPGVVYGVIGILALFGHLVRGVVFALIGYGLVRAAVDYAPHDAIGLDGALEKLSRASYGPLLLGIVAAGPVGFALYSIADARYHRD